MTFEAFDPLECKSNKATEAALQALKREIKNILSSYVGWYDPFCELIQNALDSVELREQLELEAGNKKYQPIIKITIDIYGNELSVTDNGVGLDKDQFQQFLAPNFSFKSGQARGHKGVGATYVAYGFNSMSVSTKTPTFSASGRIVNARRWLSDPAPSANPKVEPIDELASTDFYGLDRGVSVRVKFDESTHPKRLDWIQASEVDAWWKILSIKTGLGAIKPFFDLKVILTVKKSDGIIDSNEYKGVGYYWINKECAKVARIREIFSIEESLFKKMGAGFKHPDKICNLDVIFDSWTHDELKNLIQLDKDDLAILEVHTPYVSVEFGYTAKLWQKFNGSLGLRANYRVLNSGIQLAANNMPQGDVIQIPLTRNIGRQNQIHFLVHFDNYSPDMGRKGFHRELTDFAKEISRKITDIVLAKVKNRLKANTGVAPDLLREQQVANWKAEMLEHENAEPLNLISPHFFLPVERISITSKPTREQDVIALFNQLIAGGIIRGVRVMSTNERATYDGLFKVSFDLAVEKYVYEVKANPLGLDGATAAALSGIISQPKILEYKFSLDGLVEDADSGEKNLKDIDLCVVWETGDDYVGRFGITSLLVPENVDQRQFHGVTHILTDAESGARVMDLIVLSELITCLNDSAGGVAEQHAKYE
ncbi:ATP-binding protein [Rhodanobacter sp. PCA2]|uniref:ATP-binding protein n=1 Tax=Rhodanobacter sp. PCA2 TaxID=2006117 RepID=UPI0015E7343B|nr:ATP-binding protein [Rhodanobacter sp. PCA2]